MKYILVLLLSPIYLLINMFKGMIRLISDFTEPFADGMESIFNEMYDFWKRIFKWN